MYDYQGELDSQSLPCGIGTTIDEDGNTFYGTWLNGKKHGICEYFCIKFKALHS